jgi:ankyrin repeat protein
MPYTPIHRAAADGDDTKLVELLSAADVDINVIDEEGITPLHEASASGHVGCTRILVEKGADVNAHDNDGVSPLHEACANGKPQCLKVLLEFNANVNITGMCLKFVLTPGLFLLPSSCNTHFPVVSFFTLQIRTDKHLCMTVPPTA